MKRAPVTLAIESAVRGGSIALLSGETEIGSLCGEDGISRAEDLLPNIRSLLAGSGLAINEIDRIAVSLGPGSYTGIRIGIATAMGLARSTGAEVKGVPVLEALTHLAPGGGSATTAVPTGRHEFAWQHFARDGSDDSEPPLTASVDELDRVIKVSRARYIILHEGLFDLYVRSRSGSVSGKLINAGNNLAYSLGLASMRMTPKNDMAPIYLRNPARINTLF
jgi:tRNA threonylcarbamoyl adenosine modification protein YeaZ